MDNTGYIIAVVGVIASVLLIGFILIWVIEGIAAALAVTGITAGIIAAAFGLTFFWIRVASAVTS